ncbi:NAD(P)H-hydrate dehydratase [Sphingobacterium sp. HJSM2_6]|uniref:NAD(P)H-hydrate dehydratase n=1 Tax=Sphingobacterium sp. HJSM2_6 TaxID=3366264 RepID=UPI003BE50F6A
MKIFNALQLREIDRRTIETEAISSWDLMERAASQVVDYLLNHYPSITTKPIHVICGKGNNGGDGLAIARLLQQKAAAVDVFLIEAVSYSADNLLNQKLLPAVQLFNSSDCLDLKPEGYIIDCLFGFGLNEALSESWNMLIQQINDYSGTVISIDLPSGLSASMLIDVKSPIVKADETLTFQFPKETLLLPDYALFVGKWTILDIQLNHSAIRETESDVYFIDKELVQRILKPRSKFSHKGTFGHVAIVGGSLGKIGAVLMCTKAAIRTGCGLVTSFIPRCGYAIIQTAVPEAMVMLDESDELVTNFTHLNEFQAIAVGVGLGVHKQTVDGFLNWLNTLTEKQQIVFDADALNILAAHPEFLSLIPKGSIFSPHPKELKRLIGNWNSDAEKLKLAKEFAKQHQITLIIKGAHTVILTSDGRTYYNSSGNSGMATGGTGDVLTGMLVSFRAQGYASEESAVAAVYLHGLAGDYAAQQYGETSLIATDLIQHISSAFLACSPTQ